MGLVTLTKWQPMEVSMKAFPLANNLSKSFLSAFVGAIPLGKVFKLDFSAGFMKANLRRSITG